MLDESAPMRRAPFVPAWMRELAARVEPTASASPAPFSGEASSWDAASSAVADVSMAELLAVDVTTVVERHASDEASADWTLQDAASEIATLAQALAGGVHRPTPAQMRAIDDAARFGLDPALTEPVGPAPMAEWADDDLMDEIMPAPSDRRAMSTSTAEHAARTIEAVAERVRRGELALPAYATGMGDAATLAATLAALLTPKA
jgi:hypothetical protein